MHSSRDCSDFLLCYADAIPALTRRLTREFDKTHRWAARPPRAPDGAVGYHVAGQGARIAAGRERTGRSPPRSMRWSTPTRTRSARATARAWWRGRGSIPPTRSDCWRTRQRRSPSSATCGTQGEHMVVVENTPESAQPGRLHAVFLLSMAGARPAAGLVQVRAVSFARGDRSARRPAGVRPRACRRCRGARLGQHGGTALPRLAGAAGRHREA